MNKPTKQEITEHATKMLADYQRNAQLPASAPYAKRKAIRIEREQHTASIIARWGKAGYALIYAEHNRLWSASGRGFIG